MKRFKQVAEEQVYWGDLKKATVPVPVASRIIL